MSDDKVVPFVGKPDETMKLALELERNIDSYLVLQRQVAKLRRVAYLSYIDEGFTPEQALILCKT